MEWIIIVSIIVAVIIDLLVAIKMQQIAVSKGHPGSKYFHYAFWLGIAGWCIVAALPDLTLRQQIENMQKSPANKPTTSQTATGFSPSNATTSTSPVIKPQVYGRTELFVKANTEGFPGCKVTIIHNGRLTEEDLKYIETLRLEEARKFCADRKVNLISN